MSASPDYLVDGNYLAASPIGPPRFQYPFLDNKDKVSAFFEQDFWQTIETYTPPDLSIPHSAALADYYLVGEGKPVQFMANLYAFPRTYSRIPVPQITFSTIAINKPAASTIGASAGNLSDYTASDTPTAVGAAYSYAGGLFANNQVYQRKAATSSQTLPSGGTFTVTYKASTTAAQAYNVSNGNLATAINALADIVADGITVTASNGLSTTGTLQIDLTVGTTASRFTANGASLTPSASTTLFTLINSATQQFIRVGYRSTITGHGFTSSGNLVVSNATDSAQTLVPYTTFWLVIDANTIAFSVTASGGTNAIYVGKLIRAYTAGAARIRSKVTDTYYLPGVTAGITTAADIPVATAALSDSSLLTMMAANATGYQDYDAQPLALWKGQIYHQAVISVDTTNF